MSEAVRRFQSLVHAGNAGALRLLLEQDPDLCRRVDEPLFSFGAPAILIAAKQKNRELVEVLLAAGANINQRSEWPPGSFGVLDGTDEEFGGYLISRGATLDIHSAAGLGKRAEVESFLNADPSLVNARGGDGGTPLHFVKTAALADLLLAHGADVAIRDIDHGSTAAMWQIHNREVLYRLIEAGASVDIFMACAQGDLALAERALQEDPECLSSVVGTGKFTAKTGGDIYTYILINGARPISVAAHFQHDALVAWLLTKATPAECLMYFCIEGKEAEARELLSRNPCLRDTLAPSELRGLPDAIFTGNSRGVAAYLSVGFPLTGRGTDDGTVLHMAAWRGDKNLVQELIRRGADLEDANDAYGSTPLGWACHGSRHCESREGDYPGVVEALLAAGADATKPANKFGDALLDWADDGPLADQLKKHGAKPREK